MSLPTQPPVPRVKQAPKPKQINGVKALCDKNVQMSDSILFVKMICLIFYSHKSRAGAREL